MTTILITGCAGLIGANLCHYLKNKYKIIGIDNLSGGNKDFIPSGVQFYQNDITDKQIITKIFKSHKLDIIVHCAAMPAPALSHFQKYKCYNTNILGSANLINASINNKLSKFIFLSSMDVYSNNNPPYRENTELIEPKTPYGLSKYFIEQDLKIAHEYFGLNFSILRPHNYFGKYACLEDKTRNVLLIWVRRIIEGKSISVYNDGNQTRGFSNVKYLLPAVEKLFFKGSQQIYNVGSDIPCKIIDVAKLTQKIAEQEYGYKSKIEFLGARDEVQEMFCDHSKIKKDLEFVDRTNLEELIRELFEYAKSQQPFKPLKKVEPEISQGFYKYWK